MVSNALIFAPIVAGDYVITPLDGAINISNGAVSGCTDGANCTEGWQYTYIASSTFLDETDGPSFFSSDSFTGIFESELLALQNAEPVDITLPPDLNDVVFFIFARTGDGPTIGSLTIDFSLEGTFMGEIFDDVAPDITFSSDDFLDLSDAGIPLRLSLHATSNDFDNTNFGGGVSDTDGIASAWYFIFRDGRLFDEVYIGSGVGDGPTDGSVDQQVEVDALLVPGWGFGIPPYLEESATSDEPVDPATPDEPVDPAGTYIRDLIIRAVYDQDQADISEQFESVVPELQGIVVITSTVPNRDVIVLAGE